MSIESNPTSYWEMAALGIARGAIPFPLEHALERMKIESQKHIEKSTKEAIRDLWKSEGLKGLYTGSRANFIRRVTRESYHWPVMLSINRVWKSIIPEKINKDNLVTNIATGHSMAIVQAGITLPFERLLIEKTAKDGYRPFLKKMKNSNRLIIYEGFQTTLIRHSIVWDLFFVSSHTSNAIFKAIDPENLHPGLNYVGKSILTSSLVVGLGYPIEFLRNRILMDPEILSKGTLNGMKILFHRHKWVNLYSGAPVMIVHNLIQTFIIQTLIDRINSK